MFKKGDKVKCTKNSGYGYKAGNIYTVKKIIQNTLFTEVDERGDTDNGWLLSYFEHVNENSLIQTFTDEELQKELKRREAIKDLEGDLEHYKNKVKQTEEELELLRNQ